MQCREGEAAWEQVMVMSGVSASSAAVREETRELEPTLERP